MGVEYVPPWAVHSPFNTAQRRRRSYTDKAFVRKAANWKKDEQCKSQ